MKKILYAAKIIFGLSIGFVNSSYAVEHVRFKPNGPSKPAIKAEELSFFIGKFVMVPGQSNRSACLEQIYRTNNTRYWAKEPTISGEYFQFKPKSGYFSDKDLAELKATSAQDKEMLRQQFRVACGSGMVFSIGFPDDDGSTVETMVSGRQTASACRINEGEIVDSSRRTFLYSGAFNPDGSYRRDSSTIMASNVPDQIKVSTYDGRAIQTSVFTRAAPAAENGQIKGVIPVALNKQVTFRQVDEKTLAVDIEEALTEGNSGLAKFAIKLAAKAIGKQKVCDYDPNDQTEPKEKRKVVCEEVDFANISELSGGVKNCLFRKL